MGNPGLEDCRLDPQEELVPTTKVITSIPLRKPKRQEFFQVREEPEFRMNIAILEMEADREIFYVKKELHPVLATDLKRVTLYAAMSRDAGPFLWPVRMQESTGRRNSWTESAHAGAKLAMGRWIRMSANMEAGLYEIVLAAAPMPDPEWPDMSFLDMLNLAFKNAKINSLDHYAIKRLRGEP
jgi:hypothetical protein